MAQESQGFAQGVEDADKEEAPESALDAVRGDEAIHQISHEEDGELSARLTMEGEDESSPAGSMHAEAVGSGSNSNAASGTGLDWELLSLSRSHLSATLSDGEFPEALFDASMTRSFLSSDDEIIDGALAAAALAAAVDLPSLPVTPSRSSGALPGVSSPLSEERQQRGFSEDQRPGSRAEGIDMARAFPGSSFPVGVGASTEIGSVEGGTNREAEGQQSEQSEERRQKAAAALALASAAAEVDAELSAGSGEPSEEEEDMRSDASLSSKSGSESSWPSFASTLLPSRLRELFVRAAAYWGNANLTLGLAVAVMGVLLATTVWSNRRLRVQLRANKQAYLVQVLHLRQCLAHKRRIPIERAVAAA